MPRYRPRTTNRGLQSIEQYKEAYNDVLNGMSFRKAAARHGVNHVSLRRYKEKRLLQGPDNVNMGYNNKSKMIFNDDQEKYLADVIKKDGLSAKESRKFAFQVANICNVKIPSSWVKNGTAGEDWFRNFMKRTLEQKTAEKNDTESKTTTDNDNAVTNKTSAEAQQSTSKDPVVLKQEEDHNIMEENWLEEDLIQFPVDGPGDCDGKESNNPLVIQNDKHINEELNPLCIKEEKGSDCEFEEVLLMLNGEPGEADVHSEAASVSSNNNKSGEQVRRTFRKNKTTDSESACHLTEERLRLKRRQLDIMMMRARAEQMRGRAALRQAQAVGRIAGAMETIAAAIAGALQRQS